MNNDLKAIKTRLDKASPGPWQALNGARRYSFHAVGPTNSITAVNPLVLGNSEYVLCELSPWLEDGDRDFIVHSRADIEWLYDELRAARAHLHAVLNDCDEAAADAARAYLAERSE